MAEEKNKKSQNKNYDKKPYSGGSDNLKNYEEFEKFSPSRFYTEKEEVNLRFYQTTKANFKNPEYLGLSLCSKNEVIAGERRFKAIGQAGLKEIPAINKKVSNGDARIISLIENIQREDLNDIDLASALRELKVYLGSPLKSCFRKT